MAGLAPALAAVLFGCTGAISPGEAPIGAGPSAEGEPPPRRQDPASPAPTSAAPPGAAATLDRGPWRRLTLDELAGVVAVLLRADRAAVERVVATLPPDDASSRGFTIPRTANAGWVEALAAAAARLVEGLDPARVAPDWARGCPAARWGEPACIEAFVLAAGRQAFRRPLESAELAHLAAVARDVLAVEGAGPADALRATVAYLLQSPELLYLWERRPSEREEVVGGRVALSPHELAARLSFFFWAEPPDAELAALADGGALRDPAIVSRQIQRLLDDPRADRLFRRFVQQWLGLDRVSPATRTPASDGAVLSPALWAALLDEAVHYTRHVMRQGDGSFLDLMTRKSAVIDRALAAHYGLPKPATDGFVPVPRRDGGLLTLGAFLVAVASADAPSPTHFGVAVRDAILCDPLAPPPQDVATNLPPLAPGGSLRARSEAHVAHPACAGCHRHLDPIGFAALTYDHLGRPSRRGEDPSGTIVGYEEGVDRRFADIDELMRLLGGSERARRCFSRQWLRFATGLDLGADVTLPASLLDVAAGPGDVRRVIAAIADSAPFRHRDPVTQ